MGVLLRKQKGFVFTGIAKLAIILFISTFSFAFIDTIWAVYINSFVHSASLVGFISAFLTLISFFSFFFIIPLIEKSNKSKIYSYTLLLFAITYILFAINQKFYFFVILAFIATILHTLRITSFGIIVRDKSYEKNLSRNEGLMYTFMNVSWVIGPLLAGFISEKYGINLVFVLSAVFVFLAFFLFKLSKIKDANIKKKADTKTIKNFIDFFKNKNRVLAYIFGGGVNFWWSFIYLFMPLFIISNGLHIRWVGYFLFAVAFPLILLEYIFSKLAGKIGFKKIFKIGFFIPFFFALLCFFIGNVYLILLFLVLASVGLAMLEASTEAYFFDVLKKKEVLRFYAPYNTTIDLNNFISRIASATLLIFLPFKYLFLFFSIIMFLFFLVSFKTKNIIEAKRGKKNILRPPMGEIENR